MLLITVAVVAGMAIGAAARRRTARTDRVVTWSLDLVLYALLPLVAFSFGSRIELDLTTLVGILGGYSVIATVGVIAWQVSKRRLGLTRAQQGAVVLCVVLANTGYLGLPVALTLLGNDEFPQAVAWDQLISGPMALAVAPFIAGAFAGVHEDAHLGTRIIEILRRAPAIPALVLGIAAPDALVPDWLFDVASWAVYATLPLGFFAVGATIERLRGSESAPRPAPVMLVIALRNLTAPALFFLLSSAVLPDEPRAFLLQAAMPCGINALVVGHAFDLDRGLIATSIAWSTGLVLAGALIGGIAF
jgi:malate permease and related proteins